MAVLITPSFLPYAHFLGPHFAGKSFQGVFKFTCFLGRPSTSSAPYSVGLAQGHPIHSLPAAYPGLEWATCSLEKRNLKRSSLLSTAPRAEAGARWRLVFSPR